MKRSPVTFPLRYQLPAYSPVTVRALSHAVFAALGCADQRMQLQSFLCAQYHADAAVLCSSGTDALTRAIRGAARPGRKTMVGLPAYSCYDLATAAVGADADVMLYDVDPQTLAPDLDSMRRIIAVGARVVIVAPLYGMPIEWEPIDHLARSSGVTLIEDAAQGHAAFYRGRALGTFANISILSFGRGKGWTAGRGGALLVRGGARLTDPTPLSRQGQWSVVAASVAHWACGRPWSYGVPASLPWLSLGETVYHEPDDAAEMGAAAASLALATREDAERAASARQRHAQFYTQALPENAQLGKIAAIANSIPGYLRYPLRVQGGISSLGPGRRTRKLGIMPGYPKALAELEVVQRRLRGPTNFPGANELARDLITLPTHELVSRADCERVVKLIATSFPPSSLPIQTDTAAERSKLLLNV